MTMKFNIGDELVSITGDTKRKVIGYQYLVEFPGGGETYLSQEYVESVYDKDVPEFKVGKFYKYLYESGDVGTIVYKVEFANEKCVLLTYRDGEVWLLYPTDIASFVEVSDE